MSLKSANLLTKFRSNEIKQLFKNIKLRFKKMGLEILLAPRSLDYGRVLLSVPKRSGNSPQRNKLKRRTKAIFYESKLFELNFDWVVIVRSKEVVKINFPTLKKIIIDIANVTKTKNT
jgi:ribonuclease P protein component